MREIPQDILDGAQNGRDWYDAYRAVGFGHKDAMALLTRVLVHVAPSATTWPPELMEALERQSALSTKMLSDLTDLGDALGGADD